MLTKEQIEDILADEKLRHEIRNELTPPSKPKGNKIFEFLNSTFFLALITSLLIPLVLNLYNIETEKRKQKAAFEKRIIDEKRYITTAFRG
jgi:hypothetical protein